MSTIQSNKFTITVNKPIVDWSEEIKEIGEMAVIEGEEEITIEEDYTTLEAETIIIDDDSNIQTDAEYNQAVEQKELADEAREALSAVLLSVLEKGEINDDDIAEIAAQQETYIENVTALKILGIGAGTGSEKNSTDIITTDMNYDEIMKVLSEKGNFFYTNEDGDVLINLDDITITADHINLNGYVSNGDANWSIDNEGNIKAENLKIEGEVGGDILSVNYIDNPCYPATLAGSVHLYVNANTGNDDYTLDDILQSYDEAEEQGDNSLKKKFKTLQGALDASPAFLNNKTLRITLETNTTEDVYVRGFTSGAVRIYLNGKTIYGYVKGYASSPVYIYGGTVDNTTATQGVIHPNIGFNIASRCVSVGFESCQYVGLYKVKVFGADNKPSDISSDYKVAVASSAGTGSVYCSDVEITNCAIGFRTNNMGCIHAAKSSGKASRYGFESTTGGQISLADADQAGGTTANTSESSGGQIWYKSPTFDGNTTSSDTTTAPVVSTNKTMIIKSTYGDTYRSTVYNSWKKDGTVRQGDYGYGDCTGCWFFGTAFAELKGKTINKVEITITRNRGGSSSAVGLVVRTHNYSARPSGAPTLSSSSYGTLSLVTGATGTLTITNSDVLNGIKNGTVKGFGIRTTYDSAHYAVCSGSVTVKITYTE